MKDFLTELDRYEASTALSDKVMVNGISMEQGVETYQNRMKTLYASFTADALSMSEPQLKGLLLILVEKRGNIQVIPDEYISNLKSDYGRTGLASLKSEIDKAIFEKDICSTQAYYAKQAEEFIRVILNEPCVLEETPVETRNEPQREERKETEKTDNIIKGVQGLADFLGCGKNKAQAIISNGILKTKGIQYRASGWRFKRKELKELLEKYPDIFEDIHCKK